MKSNSVVDATGMMTFAIILSISELNVSAFTNSFPERPPFVMVATPRFRFMGEASADACITMFIA